MSKELTKEKVITRSLDLPKEPLPAILGESILKKFNRIFQYINNILYKFVPSHVNPFVQAGAIANTTMIIAIVTGIIVLFWYIPSVNFAYDSLESMKTSPYSAQLIRSLHRYSSDACILFAILHGAQMFFGRRFTGPRWLAWFTGIAAVVMVWLIGWLGYWLLWDVRGQEVAVSTIKFFDLLPIFSDPLINSLLTDDNINPLIFFLVFFFHMILPLPLGAAMWLHVTRLNRGKIFTNLRMTLWIIVSLIVLSLIYPAYNAKPASMSILPMGFTMDYWYLAPLYIFERLSEGTLWLMTLLAIVILIPMPWILLKDRKKEKQKPAKTDTSKCNACENCFRDCPYNAITMVPRTDGKNFKAQSEIKESLCVSCGICAGSCATMGIGLPWFTVPDKRKLTNQWIEELSKNKDKNMVAIVCGESAGRKLNINTETGECDNLPNYKVLKVPCIGWVNMVIPEQLIKKGMKGVLLISCGEGDCSNREGVTVTEGRLNGYIGPALKLSDEDKKRIYLLKASGVSTGAIIKQAEKFSKEMNNVEYREKPISKGKMLLASTVLYILFMSITYYFSDLSYATPYKGKAKLLVSLDHPGESSENCRKYTEEELSKMRPHMRKAEVCERQRAAVSMRIKIDGKIISEKTYKPAGIWEDGKSMGVENLFIEPGKHEVTVEINDSLKNDWKYKETKELDIKEGTRRVIIFRRQFQWY
ncbi:MAG: hydrogenase iron-sulfur subunit [Spirochaetia bacterium]|nr:hydrogenase iron-sulfur subunit [Spirochaetia bacterium]